MNLPDLYNEVLMTCPDAPPPLLADAVYRAAWQFCYISRLWRVNLPPLSLVAGQATYDLVGPAGTAALGVTRCRDLISGLPLTPTTELELDREHPGWEDNQAASPSMFFQPRSAILQVVYTPSTDVPDALSVRVFVAPDSVAAALPDDLFMEHRDAILAGARGRLQVMPNRPWSNVDQANMNAALFEQAAYAARQTALKSGTRGPLRMHGPEFGF
jgi:hypothetical protein